MKAALITTNLGGGGAENALLRIGRLLAARGHEMHIVLLEHIIDHVVEPNLRLHALTRGPCAKGFVGKRLAASRLRRLVDSLSEEQPFDIIVSTLPFADEVASLAGLPRCWRRIGNTLSSQLALLSATMPNRAARRAARYRRLYGNANLIAVSDGVADDLRHTLAFRSANVVRIYNPFDFEAIRRLATEPALDMPAWPYVIHVGRFAPQKRHDLLLDAWRELNVPERLVLLTHPDPKLDALIRERGLTHRVQVTGFKKNPYPWIKGARLLVLCSDHEGMPNVLVEALACGTPVVSTDCPSGPREILLGSLARWLVPCGDARQLASAIASALRDRPTVDSADLGRFDASTIAAQLEGLSARWRAPVGG